MLTEISPVAISTPKDSFTEKLTSVARRVLPRCGALIFSMPFVNSVASTRIEPTSPATSARPCFSENWDMICSSASTGVSMYAHPGIVLNASDCVTHADPSASNTNDSGLRGIVFKKPPLPSRMCGSPVSPSAASSAARIPSTSGPPASNAFESGPKKPAATGYGGCASAIPIACRMAAASRPSARPATTAPAMLWMYAHICPLCGPSKAAAPSRPAISLAAIWVVIIERPSPRAASANASDPTTAEWPVCPAKR